MKLKHVLCLFVLFSFGQLYPQQFYLKAFGGYGIGTAPDVVTTNHQTVVGSESSTSYSTETYSFGKGIDASVAAGYYLNSNISLELELGYHKSAAVNYESSYSSSAYEDKYENELKAKSFNIIPSILLHTEISSVKPYLKIGPVISFAGIDFTYDELYKPAGQDNTIYNIHVMYEYRGGITFGINSSVGIEYSLGSGINLMFEVNNKSLAYAPEEGEITEYTINGVNRLEYLNDSQKKFSFKESLSNNEQQNSGDRTKTEYPFSSLSFLLGVAVEL